MEKHAIRYEEIDAAVREQMKNTISKGELAALHVGDGGFSLAALAGDEIVGFISVYPKNWTKPLAATDAYIDVISVFEPYRRQGIATTMIARCEEWAKANGYTQIRAWSSNDKLQALPMWHALGYCMCPAKIWVEWCREIVDGYYVVKKLS